MRIMPQMISDYLNYTVYHLFFLIKKELYINPPKSPIPLSKYQW